MPLEHVDNELIREESGFSFSMRVTGTQQTIRVFVSDDALEGENDLSDETELRAQLEEDLPALETVASEKYCRGRVAADGVVAITLADVMKFTE
jgi:hypothetical protein